MASVFAMPGGTPPDDESSPLNHFLDGSPERDARDWTDRPTIGGKSPFSVKVARFIFGTTEPTGRETAVGCGCLGCLVIIVVWLLLMLALALLTGVWPMSGI